MIENPSAPLDGENNTLLFEKLREHALAPYLNPERWGCPDPAVLKSLIDNPGDITLQGSLLREDGRIGTRSKLFKACATARVDTVMAIEINGVAWRTREGQVSFGVNGAQTQKVPLLGSTLLPSPLLGNGRRQTVAPLGVQLCCLGIVMNCKLVVSVGKVRVVSSLFALLSLVVFRCLFEMVGCLLMVTGSVMVMFPSLRHAILLREIWLLSFLPNFHSACPATREYIPECPHRHLFRMRCKARAGAYPAGPLLGKNHDLSHFE